MEEKNTSRAERIDEWRKLITDCENRPGDMGMDEWCRSVGVSRTNYYYWHRKLSGAKSESVTKVEPEDKRQDQEIVRVPYEVEEAGRGSAEVRIEVNGISIYVTDGASEELLGKVMRVVGHAK